MRQPIQRVLCSPRARCRELFLCFLLSMLTREQLYEDLHQAYLDARRHKRNKPYQLRFEAHLEENLESLCDALWNRTYQPLPSDCFIITDPKRREVFAAHFRDRIVHHLYFNYTHEMPIGNLTSQLFSNVYLNQFDQFMKRELHCKHYGRYVDDFYVVSCDREWLESLVPKVTAFLSNHLDLKIHEGKTLICHVENGVEYLGTFLLPYRTYISRATLERMDAKLYALELENDRNHVCNALNSYCGVLSHWNNFNVRQMLLLKRHRFTRWGMFDFDVRHYVAVGLLGGGGDLLPHPQDASFVEKKILQTISIRRMLAL